MTQARPTASPIASAAEVPLRNRVLGAAARSAFSVINRRIEWHKLPLRLSLLNLDAFRHVLRLQNLIDTDIGEAPPKARPEPQPPIAEDVRLARSYDGTFNDLSVAQDGLRRLDLRPQSEARLSRPICSTRPMR